MKNIKLTYVSLILLHAIVGLLIFIVPIFSKFYCLAVVIIALGVVIKNSNKNNEVLYVSAYLVGVEVLLRMTKGMPNHEFAKYSIIIFMVLGMIYSNFKRGAIIYVFFLLLLVPGILISIQTLSLEANVRKAIAFNISGSACLGISAIYCYKREVTLKQLGNILMAMTLPLAGIAVYLFLYSPNIREVVTNTSSNSATSGGFGPNQVSTILGLGVFLFFSQTVLNSKTKILMLFNIFLMVIMAYRGVLTFSRGGVFTGLAMIALLVFFLYSNVNGKAKGKLVSLMILGFFLSIGVWTYSSMQTGGLIGKRYANEDALGREKESALSGREVLIETELKMFLDNPIFGIGVGKNKEYRFEQTGITGASHNEITRLLAEHGSFGILALILLISIPLVLYINNRQHIYMFSFLIFWLLTINHAAMRLAAPAFIYALSLLKIHSLEKPALHRKPALQTR